MVGCRCQGCQDVRVVSGLPGFSRPGRGGGGSHYSLSVFFFNPDNTDNTDNCTPAWISDVRVATGLSRTADARPWLAGGDGPRRPRPWTNSAVLDNPWTASPERPEAPSRHPRPAGRDRPAPLGAGELVPERLARSPRAAPRRRGRSTPRDPSPGAPAARQTRALRGPATPPARTPRDAPGDRPGAFSHGRWRSRTLREGNARTRREPVPQLGAGRIMGPRAGGVRRPTNLKIESVEGTEQQARVPRRKHRSILEGEAPRPGPRPVPGALHAPW